jgi:arginase family enzyme
MSANVIAGQSKAIFLSLDIDVVDPGDAPGTGTPKPGGLSSREMLRFISIAARKRRRAAWK